MTLEETAFLEDEETAIDRKYNKNECKDIKKMRHEKYYEILLLSLFIIIYDYTIKKKTTVCHTTLAETTFLQDEEETAIDSKYNKNEWKDIMK